MSDIVVTIPRAYRMDPDMIEAYAERDERERVRLSRLRGLAAWLEEGDTAGDDPACDGEDRCMTWAWPLGCFRPKIEPGERVYCAYAGRLIGWSELVYLEKHGRRYVLHRSGRATAVTIDRWVPSVIGFRYRFWHRAEERPFPEWREWLRSDEHAGREPELQRHGADARARAASRDAASGG